MYEKIEKITHLEIENIINSENEAKNHFLCTICFMVVKDPKECMSCNTLFCAKCLKLWLKKKKTCPMKCKIGEMKIGEPHPVVSSYMKNLKFKCAHSGCQTIENHQNALDHIKKCKYRKVPCFLKCGEMIQIN